MPHLTLAGRKEAGIGRALKAGSHYNVGTFRALIAQQPLNPRGTARRALPALQWSRACAHNWLVTSSIDLTGKG
jgi:hypothetical protein